MFGPTGLGAVYDSGTDLVSPSDTGYCRGGEENCMRPNTSRKGRLCLNSASHVFSCWGFPGFWGGSTDHNPIFRIIIRQDVPCAGDFLP